MAVRPRDRRRRGGPSRSSAGRRGGKPGFTLPFDYAATFRLEGRPGRVAEDVVNIGAEGIFVATAIGYGLEEDRAAPTSVSEGLPPGARLIPANVKLGHIPPETLISGFRVDPRFVPAVFRSRRGDPDPGDPESFDPADLELVADATPPESLRASDRDRVFQRLKPASEISFLFSMVDSATGRELQDEPTHNLASLGKSTGERPFRPLARPLAFQPRSTLRIQIIELTEGVRGTLFIVLYGYKLLDLAGCSGEVVRGLAALASRNGRETGGDGPGRRKVIPFDYVATFDLVGRPGNVLEDEVAVNVEGGFVTTSIGYGLASESADPTIRLRFDESSSAPVRLNGVELDRFPAAALLDGFRIRPEFLRLVLQPGGGVGNALADVSPGVANRAFETLGRPREVSFRYSIFDTATGRALQNRPLHNVAGLGIADGDRPFKRLARPMSFLPRSTIRVRVEEHFGRGRLFIVFQGYKLLG